MRKLTVEDFWARVERTDGCWLWRGASKDKARGYGAFSRMRAHQYSFMLHNGEIPPGMCVLHTCDNPPCVNPAHLFLGSQKVNMQDCAQKKRTWDRRGARNPKNKLSEGDVLLIRAFREEFQPRLLAARFGVTPTCIVDTCSGKRWSHLPPVVL